MKKEVVISYEMLSIEELNDTDTLLMSRAIEAAKSAYAVYSDFEVGAAALMSNGEILTANNQENIAYPSGLCAERVVAMYAKAQFPEEQIVAMAVYAADGEDDRPITPCGACRQVLAEYERVQENPIKVLLGGKGTKKVSIIDGIDTLLPLSFYSKKLGK